MSNILDDAVAAVVAALTPVATVLEGNPAQQVDAASVTYPLILLTPATYQGQWRTLRQQEHSYAIDLAAYIDATSNPDSVNQRQRELLLAVFRALHPLRGIVTAGGIPVSIETEQTTLDAWALGQRARVFTMLITLGVKENGT